jgi:hypothetical protein
VRVNERNVVQRRYILSVSFQFLPIFPWLTSDLPSPHPIPSLDETAIWHVFSTPSLEDEFHGIIGLCLIGVRLSAFQIFQFRLYLWLEFPVESTRPEPSGKVSLQVKPVGGVNRSGRSIQLISEEKPPSKPWLALQSTLQLEGRFPPGAKSRILG